MWSLFLRRSRYRDSQGPASHRSCSPQQPSGQLKGRLAAGLVRHKTQTTGLENYKKFLPHITALDITITISDYRLKDKIIKLFSACPCYTGDFTVFTPYIPCKWKDFSPLPKLSTVVLCREMFSIPQPSENFIDFREFHHFTKAEQQVTNSFKERFQHLCTQFQQKEKTD